MLFEYFHFLEKRRQKVAKNKESSSLVILGFFQSRTRTSEYLRVRVFCMAVSALGVYIGYMFFNRQFS
jgi:uncharacterized membrane protein